MEAHRFVINELMDYAGLVEKNEKNLKKMKEKAATGTRDGIEGQTFELKRTNAQRRLLTS